MKFPFQQQADIMDCGPTCLYMVGKHYGYSLSIEKLRELMQIGKEGVNLLGISDTAEKIGFKTLAVQLPFTKLYKEAPLPCIAYWGQEHFVIVYKISKNGKTIFVADPAKGLIKFTQKEFTKNWVNDNINGEETGVLLLLEPTPLLKDTAYTKEFLEQANNRFTRIFAYIQPYKKLVLQLFFGVMLASLLQLIAPFLTQSIVDIGINTSNLHFIYVVLLAQIALLAGRLGVEFIRSWILYHISSRINISILTDFLIKLMKLPAAYFDSKKTGDILQRMNDHQRIQSFLTGTSLSTIFSLFNLLVFSVVLAMFNTTIMLIFLIASILYASWIVLFLQKRKQLDYKQFAIASNEQGKTIQLIQSMQEIKLQGNENQKRWEWEKLQAQTFKLGIKGLALTQWQQTGAFLINEGKNIVITFIVAVAVINGQMTLGGMLAVQYIIGQLNSPIEQLIGFVQSWQLAKISLDRLNEIHNLPDEEPIEKNLLNVLPDDKTIEITNLSFTYTGAGNEPVLKNINLNLPAGKVTAIVGASGSGKTTLLKLLLKFYTPQTGEIKIGGNNIENISHKTIRTNCGVVMQESYIFSDSIANNIATNTERPDVDQLKKATKIANINAFIESLPLGYNTKIGAEGNGISAGQKQRILIARAVYKNPSIILFDEATNALDANNETEILKNLDTFFKGKTVLVVAHRLSTVKKADQIIVLENGLITEVGTHQTLTQLKGSYYNLVKNQLELGN
jgi:ATP-binding cassette subfamily B protein